MTLKTKQIIIGTLGFLFMASLVMVQYIEVLRKREEIGEAPKHIAIPASSKSCVECHGKTSPAIIDHWKGSTHAVKGVGCVECHIANKGDVDGFDHYGSHIATIVTPMDCARCHPKETKEFEKSHHAKGGFILASLDNFLAETVEGSRVPFNPHSPTPGKNVSMVNGMASAETGCTQCHGSKVALKTTDGKTINVDDLKPDSKGQPTVTEVLARIAKDSNGRPMFHEGSWPNTGIGRLNLDGSNGSCSACHSRHDFSPRRARQPENCAKCHLGPDHPQKEIFEESKHGVAFRDLMHHMHLDSKKWVLGQDYSQAPTCATCHMSGNLRNEGRITHDPGERISWTNRPPISQVLDTDINGKVVTTADPTERTKLTAHSAESKRENMKQVCGHCHTPSYVNAFYKQYDDFVINYNEKFGKPGTAIMKALADQKLLTPTQFDEEIEWTWFYLWHHEGRRARHGASMMAPDYAHWHGMFEVGERFYKELIPQAREIASHAEKDGKKDQAKAVRDVIDGILKRPEHIWFMQGGPNPNAPPAKPAEPPAKAAEQAK
ncbi:MAG: multiheme c-type cytochrome [Planctomycetales bacterium]